MTFKKKTMIVLMIASSALLTLPLLASAKPLTLLNATKKSFTVSVNNNCASEFGVLKVNSSKTVAEEALNKLCALNASDCKIVIFKSNDCTGEQIAGFVIDVKTGFKNTFHSAKHYSITYSTTLNWLTLTQAL
jgi:hypothetical protein